MLETLQTGIDTVWVLIAAFFVFFMQAGFGMVEAGFIRAKNTINILMKNFIDFAVASVMFFLVGYAFMFGVGNDFIGFSGFAMFGANNPSGVPDFAFLLFQTAFAGAAATIVAGAMAERTRFKAYLMYTIVVSALVYPIIGHWVWGEGWLFDLGFSDFAGSTVVHLTGGSIAVIGAKILGPRLGKYNPDKSTNILAGHNIPIAALGVFILWFGWFGFNPGSTLGVGDGSLISTVALNTNIAAAAGGIVAMVVVWIMFGKPDASMTMNGFLGGLVAITAGCAYVEPLSAMAIGAVGGIMVVAGVYLIDNMGIDDPVGAVAVHGFNGAWGTLAVGIFGLKEMGLTYGGLIEGNGFAQLGVQALGVAAVAVFAIVVMGIVFKLIDMTRGLRVSREEELKGLDIEEHGMESYPGFEIFLTE
jgi:ammonium transporter, Amt family